MSGPACHDPGGKVRLALPPYVQGGARFSECGQYRPILWRQWGPENAFPLWIGLNPSTADETHDDPTVRREWLYTRRRLGFQSYYKANVFDYRATDPDGLLSATGGPQSAANWHFIRTNAQRQGCAYVILALGVPPRPLRQQAAGMIAQLAAVNVPLFCLGLTKDGWPRHPLYMKADAPLLHFDPQPFCRGTV